MLNLINYTKSNFYKENLEMSVDVTYCLDEWEKYFNERPLSFEEFVKTYKSYDAIYPHILNKVKQISDCPDKFEYFIQGFIGSGKSTLVYLLLAYKVYLFLLLKSPKDFYGFSPEAEFYVVLYSPTKESSKFSLSAFLSCLSQIPCFKRIRTLKDAMETKGALYTTNVYSSTDVLLFKNGNNILHVTVASEPDDIIGLNVVIGFMNELGIAIDRGVAAEQIYNFYNNLSNRINSRCQGKLSALIVEKSPNDVDEDPLDSHIYRCIDTRKMEILFQKYWEVFKDKDPEPKKYANFDTHKCRLVDDDPFSIDCVQFPTTFNGIDLLEKAKNNPKCFLRDFVGMPVSSIGAASEEYKAMKKIRELVHTFNLSFCYKDNKMYIQSQKGEEIVL